MMPDPLASRMVPDPLLDSSNERLRLVAWSVVGGIAYGLVQPGGPASGPAALVAIAPLLHAMSRQAWPARLVAGWLTGSLAAAIACGETAWTGLGAYFALDGLVLAGAWLLAHQLLGALPFVVFAGLAGDPASGSSARSALRVAGAWVLGELAREALLPGAWLSLASALTSAPRLLDSAALESPPRLLDSAAFAIAPRLLDSAAVVGALGVSAWLAAGSLLALRLIAGPDRRGAAVTSSLLATLLVATALWQGLLAATDGAPVMRVDLVQSGLDTRRDRPRPSEAERLSQLEGMTPTDGQAELVVWPESALGTLWPMNAEYLERAADRPGAAAPLVLGVPWLEPGAGPEGLGVAAVLLDAQRRVVARHLKTRLLPFAEDRRGLATRRPDRGSPGFVAGESSVLLDAGSTPIGVSICYEVLFPEVARGQVRSGARLLLNLSNESWLGASGRGPDHMLAAAMLRAAETGRPMLRATTIGLTAAIDAQGRVAAALPRGGPGLLRTEVRPAARWTPFVRFGRAPVVLLAVVVVAVELVRSHRAD